MEHPNRTAERIKCDMALLWADVCDLIRTDVGQMQAAIKDRVWPSTYTVDPEESSSYTLMRRDTSGQERLFRWRYEAPKSRVVFTLTNPTQDYLLTTRWDASTGRCIVRIEDCQSLLGLGARARP